jgi:ketosteroid isomerase-like protein
MSMPKMSHLLSTLTIAVLVAIPVHAETSVTDDAQVVAAMRIMFIAATNNDLAYFNTVDAPDFYAFDGGSVYVWTITDPEVNVSGDIAWITYVNRGSVKNKAGKKKLTWLESAVLRKDSGKWRIHFFHSTRVP